MGLFGSPQQAQKTDQKPQQNQYLTANPATDNNANTNWMSPSDSTGNSGGNSVAQSQPNPPSQVSNGTMLGSIAQGNSGGMNFGTSAPTRDQLLQFSQGKGSQFGDSSLNYWSNPNKWSELVNRGRELQPGSDGSWYANKFLNNAEEFTGGAHQTAMNMWGYDPAEQGNNQQGGLMSLLQQLLGGGGQMNNGPRQQDMKYNQYAGKNLPPTPGAIGGNASMIGQNGNTGITGGMIKGNVQPLEGGMVTPQDSQQQGQNQIFGNGRFRMLE